MLAQIGRFGKLERLDRRIQPNYRSKREQDEERRISFETSIKHAGQRQEESRKRGNHKPARQTKAKPPVIRICIHTSGRSIQQQGGDSQLPAIEHQED